MLEYQEDHSFFWEKKKKTGEEKDCSVLLIKNTVLWTAWLFFSRGLVWISSPQILKLANQKAEKGLQY